MIKDIIIAALAGYILLGHPWLAVCTTWEKAAIWLGLTMCLLFFWLFCEEAHEKWLKRRERVDELRKLVERLADGKGGTGDAPERSDIQ